MDRMVQYQTRVDPPRAPVPVPLGWQTATTPQVMSKQFMPTAVGYMGDVEVPVVVATLYEGWRASMPDRAPVRPVSVTEIADAGGALVRPAPTTVNAWVVAADLLPRLPRAPLPQDIWPGQGAIVSLTPQGWVPSHPDRVRWPMMPVQAQQVLDLPAQPVPTRFVANDWTVVPLARIKPLQPGLYPSHAVPPAAPPAPVPQGWPVEAPVRSLFRAAQPHLLPNDITTALYVASVTPQGWPATHPDRVRWPALAAPQQQALALPAQQVPTAFVGNAWVVTPDRVAFRALQPGEFPQDTTEPPAPLVTAPQGWRIEQTPAPRSAQHPQGEVQTPFYPATPAITALAWGQTPDALPVRRAPRAGGEAVLPVQQVPTVFVPQAWTVQWDPVRKPFNAALQRADDPVLGAYVSVVIVYAEGWRVQSPSVLARRRFSQPAGEAVVVRASLQPQGWTASVDVPPRAPARRDIGQSAAVSPAARTIWGFDQVQAPLTARAAPRATAQDAPLARQVAPQGARVQVWSDPARRAPRPAAWQPDAIPQVVRASTLPFTDLWSWQGFHMRTVRPVPGEFGIGYRIVIVPTRIISQPTLFGGSTAPTLGGASITPTLYGASTAPALQGGSTAPSLQGASTNPTLEGEV